MAHPTDLSSLESWSSPDVSKKNRQYIPFDFFHCAEVNYKYRVGRKIRDSQ